MRVGDLGRLGGERRDGLGPHVAGRRPARRPPSAACVELARDDGVGGSANTRSSSSTTAARTAAPSTPRPLGAGEAVLAEAEAEQVAGALAELDEVALVVVAVLEPVVVQRLGEDRRHLVARDVGDERAHVGAHVRVGRAEVGRVRGRRTRCA